MYVPSVAAPLPPRSVPQARNRGVGEAVWRAWLISRACRDGSPAQWKLTRAETSAIVKKHCAPPIPQSGRRTNSPERGIAMVDLRAKPYRLSGGDAAWVRAAIQ